MATHILQPQHILLQFRAIFACRLANLYAHTVYTDSTQSTQQYPSHNVPLVFKGIGNAPQAARGGQREL